MKRLAIIGMGPRGLYALENLLIHCAEKTKELKILIFETSNTPGAGMVWHPKQSDSNWMNITERALEELTTRPTINYGNITLNSFPSYHDWCRFSQDDMQPDSFPSRKKLGEYLNERFDSIAQAFKNVNTFEIVQSKIIDINLDDRTLIISSENESYKCDDVLLTIGHQPTEQSEQIREWEKYSIKNKYSKVYEDPYPMSQFDSIKNGRGFQIAIRGFGLAMIDIMRFIAINNFGNFKVIDTATLETVYYKVEDQDLKLVPFSLDGLPMAPKPLNKNIDDWYKPQAIELKYFKTEIESFAQTPKEADSINFLKQPIAKITARIFLSLNEKALKHDLSESEIEAIVVQYLDDADYKHELLQDGNISTYNLIKAYINMALGEIPVSLDYCLGQVWRHCQPTLYKAFSYATLDHEIIEQVISLDERSKRYSYGPPIQSMQQILALVDANVLTLDFVNNPEISLIDKGWRLKNKNDETINCHIMINSVLDSPKLLEVNSPIVKNLLQNDLIQPIHNALGIDTLPNGLVISSEVDKHVPIAVLGRLAKGSVIGVDAILECFGPRIEDWAKAYVNTLDT